MDILLVILRLVHIVSGALWVGVAFFLPAYLMPAIQDAGPAGGPVMQALQKRGITTLMPVLAVLTLVSGLWLYWILSDGFGAAYVQSTVGGTLLLGGVTAIVAFIVGMTMSRPAMMKAMALGARAQTAPEAERPALMAEIAALRVRGARAARVLAAMLVAATAMMAVARYL